MACRRCGECMGSEHHWTHNGDFGNDEDPDDDDEELTNPDFEFTCKHCPAVGGECPDCDGDGTTMEPRFEADDQEVSCEKCKGTGVIEGLAYTGWREE